MKHRINRLFSLFICCLFFLQHQVTDSAYTNGYNMIREFDVDSRFAADAASWSVVGGQQISPAYTQCGTTWLMGGYCVLGCSGCSQIGNYYGRSYSGLPPHNSIRFAFTFWAIDSWDLAQTGHDDGFELGFDSTIINGWYMSLGMFPTQVCGIMTNAWNELPNLRIFGTIPHTASTLNFRVISDLNEESCNESFGFRDISFIFDQNPATAQTMCGTAPISLPNRNCQCPEGQYWTGSGCAACNGYCSSCFGPLASQCYACANSPAITYDGTACVPCYSGCATCFGGALMQCLTCAPGFIYIPYTRECATLYCPWPLVATTVSGQAQCLTPCFSIDLFVYPDGVTCSSSCPAPFQQITFHTVIKYCINPCSPTEYLYWDGSCQHDCAYPLTIQNTYRNQKLCTYSCGLNQYLDWNGNCQASCDSPLVNRTQNNKYFCMKPCGTNQYLYWNGDCVNSCTGYLTITTSAVGVSYCNFPCLTTQYLYWDGSCQSTCPYPLQTRVEKERLYCDYPTSSANFLYWDGTSSATCSGTTLSQRTEGNSPNQRKFCDNSCSGYLYWNGSCFNDCPFPLTITVTNNKQYCGYSCTGSAPYLYWNGSCGGSCNSPYKIRTEGGKTFCDYPCLTDQYLYWDGTCSYDCSGYLVKRIEGAPMMRRFCDFPCKPTESLYWNGTCKTSCSGGALIQTTISGNKYCNFKCSGGQYYYNSDGICRDDCDANYLSRIENSVERYCGVLPSYTLSCSDYYYWNHTCHTTCPSPLVEKTVGTQKWCLYPCQTNQFAYPDSRCFDTCDIPFTPREELGYKYCDYLCDSSSFAYWNGSCLPICLPPLRTQTTRYGQSCLLPCDNSAIYYHAKSGTCMEECSAPAISPDGDYPVCLVYTPVKSDGSFLDVFIQGPSTPGTPSFASIIKMLQYVRFLDIEMPPRLRDLTMTRGRSIVTLRFGQYMPDEMIATYIGEDLPDVFSNHHMHSEFIVNFWGELSSWALVGLVIVFLAVFESICVLKDWKSGQKVFGKLKILARWNLPLIMLATSVDDIVFFTALEIIGIGNTSGLSIVLCLVMLALIIMVVIAIKKLVPVCVIAKRKIVLYNNSGDYEGFLEKWKDCQILYKGFRDHIQPNDYFFLLYMGRIAFPMLIASILFAVPILQAIIYVLFSLAVLGYIIYMKPLNRKINHLQLILIESIVLVVNIALLGLSIIDIRKSWDSSAFVALGDIVVYGNLAINVLLVIFLVWKIVDGALAIHKNKGKDRTMWLQLIVFYLQQGGMGFEEMFIDNKTAEIFNQRQYVIDEEKRLVEVERERLFAAKKNKLLDNEEADSPRTNRRSTFLKRTTIIEEPTQEEDRRPPSLIINPQKIEMDDKHKLINETSFTQQSPGYTFSQDDDGHGSPDRDRIRDVVSNKFGLESHRAGYGSIHDKMRLNLDSPQNSNRMMLAGTNSTRAGNHETLLSLTKVDSNSSPPAARGNEKRLGIDFTNSGGNNESTYDNQNSLIMRNIQKQNISGFSNYQNQNN